MAGGEDGAGQLDSTTMTSGSHFDLKNVRGA